MLTYDNSFYCINIEELKKLCRKYKDKKACCNFETNGYLIPVKEVEKISTILYFNS